MDMKTDRIVLVKEGFTVPHQPASPENVSQLLIRFQTPKESNSKNFHQIQKVFIEFKKFNQIPRISIEYKNLFRIKFSFWFLIRSQCCFFVGAWSIRFLLHSSLQFQINSNAIFFYQSKYCSNQFLFFQTNQFFFQRKWCYSNRKTSPISDFWKLDESSRSTSNTLNTNCSWCPKRLHIFFNYFTLESTLKIVGMKKIISSICAFILFHSVFIIRKNKMYKFWENCIKNNFFIKILDVQSNW